jgi:peptidyl-prolyl cis-trans isomerase D
MERLRKKSNKIVLGFVFIIIVVSFVFWGVGDVEVSAPGSLTSVNGEEIPYEDFQWQYRIQYDFQERLRGGRGQISEDDIKRLEASVASSLVMQTLMGQRAESLGFKISDSEILDKLKETKVFNDPEKNRFSPSMYGRVLEANGISQAQYERTLKRDLLGTRLRDLLEMSILVSDAELGEIQQAEQNRFILDVASWDEKSLAQSGVLKATDAALKDFYEKHKGEFLSTPQRSATIAALSPIAVERSIEVSEDEISSFFNSSVKTSKDEAWTSPQAHAYHLLISDSSAQGLKQLKEIETKIKASKDVFAAFRQAAAEYSEDFSNAPLGGDLGYFGEKAMVKPFAAAVFSGKAGTIIGPVKTDFGYHLIFLADRTSGPSELSNRKKQISYEIRRSKLQSQISEIEKAVADRVRGAGDKTQAELEKLGFTFTESQNVEPNKRSVGVPFLLNQKIFEAPLGKWSEPSLVQGSIFIVKVQRETPPAPLSFEDAKNRVKAKWEAQETEAFVRSQLEGLKSKKLSWNQLAKSGATLKSQKDFKPHTALEVPGLGGSESALRAAQGLTASNNFAGPLMHEGKWILLRGDAFRSEPPKALSAEERLKQKQNLRDERKTIVLDSYLQNLIKESSIPADFRAKYRM